ncbi:TIR domain-containing protein [Pseudomonadota bacterium]
MKPKAFIASSVEGLSIAYSIQSNLDYDVDSTAWPQGVFNLSESPLDSLIDVLEHSDFGIFVFSADDVTKMRNNEHCTVRDNVLFELGLFIGKLGKRRCFIVMPDQPEMHLPTDLMGVTPAKFNGARDDLTGALGPACHQIRLAIQKIGRLDRDNESECIPVNTYDNYDDNDNVAILEAWLGEENEEKAIKFVDVDNELGLEIGTAKKYLPKIINTKSDYKMLNQGSNVFRFVYVPRPVW